MGPNRFIKGSAKGKGTDLATNRINHETHSELRYILSHSGKYPRRKFSIADTTDEKKTKPTDRQNRRKKQSRLMAKVEKNY